MVTPFGSLLPGDESPTAAAPQPRSLHPPRLPVLAGGTGVVAGESAEGGSPEHCVFDELPTEQREQDRDEDG